MVENHRNFLSQCSAKIVEHTVIRQQYLESCDIYVVSVGLFRRTNILGGRVLCWNKIQINALYVVLQGLLIMHTTGVLHGNMTKALEGPGGPLSAPTLFFSEYLHRMWVHTGGTDQTPNKPSWIFVNTERG